jgi:simple sugar transport system ATP-binding protein
VIAREMGRDFTLLLAAQPTRGVDVGAIEFIHEQIRMARNAGKGILLVSADLSEVLALSDRIAVMYGGRFVTVTPAAEATAESLGRYMTGAAS